MAGAIGKDDPGFHRAQYVDAESYGDRARLILLGIVEKDGNVGDGPNKNLGIP
jgi:hypothetical protein